ncbi:MAG TPA: ethanolamine ammonia-lyase subunit EutB [Acidobacteriaceae bacterium]|jgi:ethanolamine ammonia-lyase large subunit
MPYRHTVRGVTHTFADLRTLLAKASPRRSGDELAGIAAAGAEERAIAQITLAELSLSTLTNDLVVPYETDAVTRLIVDTLDQAAFAPFRDLTIGEFRDWLLSDEATGERLAALAPGLMPEMAAAVSKLMRAQDLVYVARKISVVTRFRTTVGLPGRLATRLQPNHPTDDPAGIAASMLDGLLLGSGDAVIGINPVSDSVASTTSLLRLIDHVRARYAIPTQNCVLAHITTQMEAIAQGAPLDLLFQSIAGTEAANASFGITLPMLREAHAMARELGRGGIGEETGGERLFYFETGQGSALSANAHHGVDQQTLEARAYAVARAFHPFLVNTVVGFIGPEYLYDGKQILRAGLEDHFCGKLLGLPMGCDICYTNHAEADGDDMDALLTMLGAAGVNYIMGVPGADDIMLNYQSTSFHDALYLRRLLGLRPSPEFEAWLASDGFAQLRRIGDSSALLPAESALPAVSTLSTQ